jgi:CheY-like chemotaxis protein
VIDVKQENSAVKDTGLGPILIVDDNKDDRFMLGCTMKALFGEIPIRTFSSGAQLLEYLGHACQPDAGPAFKKPRLVIMDLNMPETDGFIILHKMRNEMGMAETPVVIVSDTIDSDVIEMTYQSGANAFLSKNFSRLDFIQAARRDERLACIN